MNQPSPSDKNRCCDWLLVAIGLVGFLGVALGAFGAHALNDTLVANDRLGVWQTAVLYHLVHVVAALAILGRSRAAAIWWLIGVMVFSGSLYLLAITNIGLLGAITPIGGVAFLIGWALLIPAARRARGNQ